MRKFISSLVIFLVCVVSSSAQYTISSTEGYSPQIGALVNMLDDLKERVTYHVRNLNQEDTDFLLDEDANRIGALILHLAATERHYQKVTFENTTLHKKKDAEWLTALRLGEDARNEFKDKPISYYLDKWNEVRAKTKELLKTKDDEWLTTIRSNENSENEYNHYWSWYHVMEHQANHMGQIVLIKKRIK